MIPQISIENVNLKFYFSFGVKKEKNSGKNMTDDYYYENCSRRINTVKLKFIIEKSYRGLNKQKYKTLLPYLKKTHKLYQKSWDEINDGFFKTVDKITGYSWKYKTYFCVLSPFYRGISSWGGNKIVRTWRENPYSMRKITAHELLISHIFTIFEKDFQKENLTDKQKWALAEISAWAITGLEKKMLKFWPWISEDEKYPLNHNYPELYNLQRKLKLVYAKKKNFRSFLQKSIKIIRREKL